MAETRKKEDIFVEKLDDKTNYELMRNVFSKQKITIKQIEDEITELESGSKHIEIMMKLFLYLEYCLSKLLLKHKQELPKTMNSIIKICYMNQIISKGEGIALNKLRNIRNDLAHFIFVPSDLDTEIYRNYVKDSLDLIEHFSSKLDN